MFAHMRHRQILDLLAEKRRIKVADLNQLVGASAATIRRDLAAMESQGLCVRVHGGVLHPDAALGEPHLEVRQAQAVSEKRAMARVAADLVHPRMSVYIDAGSTCLELAKLLLPQTGLTMYTHSLPVLHRARETGARVVGVGGRVKEVSQALVSDLALAWLGRLRFDMAFLGASGLSLAEGASTTAMDEAAVKQHVAGRAHAVVLLAHGDKWEHPSTVVFAPWQQVDTWVTSAGMTRRAAVRRLPGNVEVLAAPKGRKKR